MTPRGRIILSVVAVILVALLFFFFFIQPRRSELAEVRQEVEDAQADQQTLRAELARLQELQRRAPRLEAELAEIRELVPQEHQVPNFIFLVQEAANRSGVGFLSVTPQLPAAPPEGAAVAEISAAITARGGYFAIQDFLRRLTDLDRALRVDAVTMSGQEGQAAGETTVGLNVTSRIFFELPEAAPGAAPSPTPEA